jgi:hypothetical protein
VARPERLSPGERWWVAGEAPCLEDRGVNNLIKTGVAYDNQSYHPAASAYDRRHGVTRAAVIRDAAVSIGPAQFGVIKAVAPSLRVEVNPINMRDVRGETPLRPGHLRFSVRS